MDALPVPGLYMFLAPRNFPFSSVAMPLHPLLTISYLYPSFPTGLPQVLPLIATAHRRRTVRRHQAGRLDVERRGWGVEYRVGKVGVSAPRGIRSPVVIVEGGGGARITSAFESSTSRCQGEMRLLGKKWHFAYRCERRITLSASSTVRQ